MEKVDSHRFKLTNALLDGSCLIDSSSSSPSNFKLILEDRLEAYYARTKGDDAPQSLHFTTLENAQAMTAKEALSVVERVQSLLDAISLEESPAEQTPVIGTRDLGKLRMLLSLVVKWGTEPALNQVDKILGTPTSLHRGCVVDLEGVSTDYDTLSSLIIRVVKLLFPEGIDGRLTQTAISTIIMNRHIANVLHASITVGWLPKALSTTSMPVIDCIRPLIMRLISILPPSSVIAALGTVLSSAHTLPSHVRKTCSSLLTQQLLRQGGVAGLCESVFGEEESSGEDVKLEKLEKISRTLISVPSKMTPWAYYQVIIPRIIQLLSEKYPPSYRKTAAFTISLLVGSNGASSREDPAITAVHTILHTPFLQSSVNTRGEPGSSTSIDTGQLTPSDALSKLIMLISNSDPSPILISNLLSPIIPALYSFSSYLTIQKTSDPMLKEAVQGLLISWGKIVDAMKAINVLWSVIEDENYGSWKADSDGNLWRSLEPPKTSSRSMLTPSDIKQDDELDVNINLFDFYPDPAHFVRFLQSLDRGDVVSSLFVKLLETYRKMKSSSEMDSLKILHYLQIIMQMQIHLSGNTTSGILHKPDQLLAFIKHVLESASESARSSQSRVGPLPSVRTLSLDIPDDVHDETQSIDSDDDMPDSEIIKPDDEMLETTINLLLSILESRESLSDPATYILNDIFLLLQPLSRTGSSSLLPLAREARMVITARSASSSTGRSKPGSSSEQNSRDTYQKALKLLQDPILPVRAHGLLLLRDLVTPIGGSAALTDPALIPAILSIFLQAIQDEDSYIFLNAVQGLVAMVDGFSGDVFQGLIREYSDGLDISGSTITQGDLDVRIRIGEALGSIIKRCGESLGKYGDILIPALIRVFKFHHIPVTLRTSALSLLADCIDTYPFVMLPYVEVLAQGMIDLLQIESTSARPSEKTKETHSAQTSSLTKEAGVSNKTPVDEKHLTIDPKYPPLRRAALHLLALLIRTTIRSVVEERGIIPFSAGFIKRSHITLGYVMVTDDDAVVRVMAREAKEDLSSLQESLLTL